MAAEVGVVAQSANKFALDLHEILRNEDNLVNENLFYSPASLLIALAMTILGDPGAVIRVGRKGGTKVFITGERAPGYRLSPDHFQKFKRVPAPDWAQKMLCIIVPNRRTHLNEFFSCVRK